MKIFCVGRNNVDHAKELGNDIPDEPVIFLKPKSAVLQPHMPFYYPEFTNELHYEVELVLRVSKNGKYIQEKHASKYYNGITVGIDFTARDIQQKLKEMNSSGASDASSRKDRSASSRNAKSYAAAARLLGGIMGEKVFWAYTNKRLRFPKAKSFLFQNI